MTMTNSMMKCDVSVSDVSSFLSEYSGLLFGSGSTCVRLEKNVQRIARSVGMSAEITILPRHIHLTLTSAESSEVTTAICSIKEVPINFNIITLLSRLSWQMADGELCFSEGCKKFESISSSSRANPWLVLILVSFANAAFCRLFGGDFIAMGLVFAATFAGFCLKQTMTLRKIDPRIVTICCAFVSTVISAADDLFSLGDTPMIAIGTSVLYLIPGIPLINSFCDMIDRHYICAFGRLMNAVVILFCLSVGLCAGMWLMDVKMFS